MKRWIGLLSVLLACILICAGCGSEKVNVKGTFVPLDSEADPNSEYFEGGTYTNEYFGFVANFSEDNRIDNPKKYIAVSPNIALSGCFGKGAINIHVFDAENQENIKDKSTKEIAVMYLKAFCEKSEEGNASKNIGDYYEIELEFIGKKITALAVKTDPLFEGVPDGIAFYIPLRKDEFVLGIIGELLCAKSSEDVQNFLNEIFAALP